MFRADGCDAMTSATPVAALRPCLPLLAIVAAMVILAAPASQIRVGTRRDEGSRPRICRVGTLGSHSYPNTRLITASATYQVRTLSAPWP
jgi:hypothetical protein